MFSISNKRDNNASNVITGELHQDCQPLNNNLTILIEAVRLNPLDRSCTGELLKAVENIVYNKVSNQLNLESLKALIDQFSVHSKEDFGVLDDIFCQSMTNVFQSLETNELVEQLVQESIYIFNTDPNLYRSCLYNKFEAVLSDYSQGNTFLCASDSKCFIKLNNKHNEFLKSISPGIITSYPEKVLLDVQRYLIKPESIQIRKVPTLLRFFDWGNAESELKHLLDETIKFLESKENISLAVALLEEWEVGGFNERVGVSIQSKLLSFLTCKDHILRAIQKNGHDEVYLYRCFQRIANLPLDRGFFNQETLGAHIRTIQASFSSAFTEFVTLKYGDEIVDRFEFLSESLPGLDVFVTHMISYDDSITDEDVEVVFDLFPNIEDLDLQSDQITKIPSNVNRNLQTCKICHSENLNDISSLVNTCVSDLTIWELPSLEGLPEGLLEKLKILDMDGDITRF